MGTFILCFIVLPSLGVAFEGWFNALGVSGVTLTLSIIFVFCITVKTIEFICKSKWFIKTKGWLNESEF